MTIIDGPNWCLWLVTTFEHVTFSPPLLSILVFKPILFHTIVTEGHYMLCSIEKFCFLRSRAELLIVVWQMTCQRSHMFWCALCSHHVFVLLVQFALVHLKISVCLASPETGVAFLQEDNHTHQFAWVLFFWDRCLRLSPSLLTLFVIWHSGTSRFKYRFSPMKSADYFVFCIYMYMPLWFTLGIIPSVEGIWLGVPLMRSLVRSHNFFATARKIIYAACSIQAGKFFIGQN